MRLVLSLFFAATMAVSCGSSAQTLPVADTASTAAVSSTTVPLTTVEGPITDSSGKGPGGYGFDRSDPEAGIANIMEAFATDEETATCIYAAWGDVANVPPAELTPELMTYEVCGTSVFQLISGDPRFTATDG